MQTIILLSCVSKKLDIPCSAEQIYDSPLFKKSLSYAKSLKPNHIHILSAKYHVLNLEQVIEPYNETLNKMSDKQIQMWSIQCLEQLMKMYDLKNDHFVYLAGDKYRKYLLPYTKNYSLPLEGLRIGEQMQWYNKQLNNDKIEENIG